MAKKIKKLKFLVGVREVHVSQYEVEVAEPSGIDKLRDAFHQKGFLDACARSAANEAIERGDEPVSFEYSHTMDQDNWSVEPLP